MFHAYTHPADGKSSSIDSPEGLGGVSADVPVWIDLEAPTEDELTTIAKTYDLDPAAVEDCLRGEQRPRIDDYKDYIFVLIYGVLGSDEAADFNLRKLVAFCGRNFLVTVHEQPLKTIGTLRRRCAAQAAELIGRGADHTLYTIIDAVVDNYILATESYEEQLEVLEDRSLDPTEDDHLLSDAAAMRRSLLDIRRVAVAQRQLLLPVAKGEYDFVSPSLGQLFSHVRDHLSAAIDSIDGLRELLTSVRDNYHATLANRTNEIVKTLTIYAGIMLPLSVIAGIYGMNLPVWPSPEQPASFWIVLGAMGGIAAGLFIYFRGRKWI